MTTPTTPCEALTKDRSAALESQKFWFDAAGIENTKANSAEVELAAIKERMTLVKITTLITDATADLNDPVNITTTAQAIIAHVLGEK